jgi:tellurite resistance protein TerA
LPVLTKGQKLKLKDLTETNNLKISLKLGWDKSVDLDVSCFGLDEQGQLSDDKYFVYYNQKKSPEGAVELSNFAKGQADFVVNLDKLPSKIRRLTFTLTVDGDAPVSGLTASSISVADANSGGEILSFPFTGADFSNEKAIMLFDVYFKDQWRVAAVCQGFNQGLKALLEHFGGLVSDVPPSKPVEKPSPGPTVSLKKVTLEKRGDAQIVDLTKKSGGSTSFHVNLNWDPVEKKGWLRKRTADLDLGCMFELIDGRKGVIQALGDSMGAKSSAPWIYLDKDDRSGASSDGENLYILRPDQIKRVLIFAFIYEGDFNFVEVNGRILIKEPDGSEILIKLNNPDAVNKHCAICLLANINGEIKITKEEKYVGSHIELDVAYGFGFRWVAGRK